MNYEEKYNQALERATRLAFTGNISATAAGEIFPELRESEDERIRKAQLDYWRSVGGKEWYGVPVQETITWLEKQAEQKPAWNEEDERILNKIQDNLREFYVDKKGYPYVAEPDSPEMMENNWLKSLKDRLQPQPKQEWSEEDKHCIELLLPIIDSSSLIPKNRKKCKNFLKSLKPNHWKPSEEQMSMLLAVLNDPNNITSESVYIALKLLYNDLKNL